MHVYTYACADLEGGRGGPDPPGICKKIPPILLEMKKKVNFHICALPQLYVKVGPPLEKFSGSAPAYVIQKYAINMSLVKLNMYITL